MTSRVYELLESDLRDRDGDSRRLGPASGYQVVPALARLDDDESHLLWWAVKPPQTYGALSVQPRSVGVEGTLDEFLRIRTPRDVLRFARRRGVLELCEHGLPASHRPPPPIWGVPDEALPDQAYWCVPVGRDSPPAREPIERWMHFVDRANAIARLGVQLRRGAPGDPGEWDAVGGAPLPSIPDRLWQLGNVMNSWLQIGGVRPYFHLGGGEALTLQSGLFGKIALELVALTLNARSWAFCSTCSRLYVREGRAASAKRGNHCPECRGSRAAINARQDRSRTKARVRAAKERSDDAKG